LRQRKRHDESLCPRYCNTRRTTGCQHRTALRLGTCPRAGRNLHRSRQRPSARLSAVRRGS
jgi:hypothetical protein